MTYKILIVDDDPHIIAGLRRALHRESYPIISATSAPEALEIMKSQAIDVIISDEQMPEMTGAAFLTRVNELYPDTIRFILTGQASLEAAVQAINEGGVRRFFLKPCNVQDLKVAIRQELQTRDLMVAARHLLHKVKHQSQVLRELEADHPNILKVERDPEGAIWVEDSPADYDKLMREIMEHLGEPAPVRGPSR